MDIDQPPRIVPAAAPFDPDIRQWLERTMPPGVAPLALFTTLATDKRLFTKLFGAGLLDRGHLTLRQREIVIDRITALCRSEYEWGVHIAFFGQKVKFGQPEIDSLVHGGAGDACWQPAEQALLRCCDSLHQRSTIDEALWSELASHFSASAILEILMLAGFYRTISYLTNALNLPLEPFSARCPPRPRDAGVQGVES
jgi:alkylhydroperoxidase family enzyme